MKFSIKIIFFTLLLSNLAFAQTASILPPAKTTFFDSNGKPLTSGTVDFYIPTTTTRKTTWQDADETIPNANPVVLDGSGRALILGSGSYRQVVKDRLGNLIWDQVTFSTGSGGSTPTATGDGDLVGTIKPWAGLTAPNQYMFTYGQEISRTTYDVLFTAITSTQAVFCSSGSPILTGLGDTTNFPIGANVEVSCVVSGNSTIVSKTSSSITLAANANISTNTTAIIFPWGDGNHTTTFNLPDFRGLVPVGNNNMGGVASTFLRTVFYGTDPNSIGGRGGSDNQVILLGNLPAYTPSGTVAVTNGAITVNSSPGQILGNGGSVNTSSGGAQSVVPQTVTASQATSTATFIGVAQGGTSAAFSIVTPSKTTNYIIKVTPDVNSATASGVTSLGGMTGSIACGAGLLCTGNTISNIYNGTVVGPGTSVIGNIATWNDTVGHTLANSSISTAGGNLNILNETASGGGINGLNAASSAYKTLLSIGTSVVGVNVTRLVSAGDAISFETASRSTMGYWGDSNQRFTIGTDDAVGEAGLPTLLKVVSNNITFSGNSGSGQILVFRNTNTACAEDSGLCSYSIYSQGMNSSNILTNSTILNCGILHRAAGVEAGDCDMKVMVAGVMRVPMAWDGLNVNIRPDQANVWPIGTTGAPYKELWVGTGVNIKGSVSGSGLIQCATNCGSPVLTVGTGTGTIVVSASSPLVANATTGNLTCPTCATTGGSVASFSAGTTGFTPNSATTGAVTLGGTLIVANGGTGLTSGTSGGIPYFNSTSTIASSTLLTANAIVLGGGAGTAPTTLASLGTTTTLLHGNAAGAPTFSSVVSADLNITTTTCTNQFLTAISATGTGICTNVILASAQFANQGTTTTVLHGNGAGNPSFGSVVNADLSTMVTNTVKGNATSGTATPTDLAVGSCSTAASALIWTTNTGFGCNTSIIATTNANLTGAITSVGNATSLGSFTSANLNGALTDETGTGVAVFGTSPILTTVDARGTWTTGTSWTLPAHTLGGTVSGGGNQLNNIIIGTTTPLAGSFTTLGASGITTITNATAGGNGVGALVLSAGGASISGQVNIGGVGIVLDGANQILSMGGITAMARNTSTGAITVSTNGSDINLTPASNLTSLTGTIKISAMVQTAVAQSGTVCYNSGTGAVTYDATLGCLASTMEVKEGWLDISPDKCLLMALSMKSGSFNYQDGKGLPKGEQIGFNAQQIAMVDERLVARDTKGKLLGVRYQQASSLYACAIQKLYADNNNLEQRLSELEKRK